MNKKTKTIISVALGVSAIITAAFYLSLRSGEIVRGDEVRSVLVAVADIKPHTLMEPGLVKGKKVPRRFIQPGAIFDKKAIQGRVTTSPIKKGEQIVETKLVSAGSKVGLSYKISRGKRAVSLKVSDADAVGGLIRPDDRVDVVVTIGSGRDEGADKYSYTLFQDVEVLSVGNDLYSVRNPEGVIISKKKKRDFFGGAPGIGRSETGAKIVTFALNPDDAQRFVFAEKVGEVSLLLRSPLDRSVLESVKTSNIDSITGERMRRDYNEYRGR